MLQVAPQPTTSAQHNWSVNNDPWCIFIWWYIVIYHTHSYTLFHGGEVDTFTDSVIKRRSDSFSHHHIEATAASQLHCLFQMEMNHHLPHTSGTAFFQFPPKCLKSKCLWYRFDNETMAAVSPKEPYILSFEVTTLEESAVYQLCLYMTPETD